MGKLSFIDVLKGLL